MTLSYDTDISHIQCVILKISLGRTRLFVSTREFQLTITESIRMNFDKEMTLSIFFL